MHIENIVAKPFIISEPVRVFRTVCRRAWSCLIPSVTISGSRTPPSSCSSTRRICSRRRSRSPPSPSASQSTQVGTCQSIYIYIYNYWWRHSKTTQVGTSHSKIYWWSTQVGTSHFINRLMTTPKVNRWVNLIL